MSGDRIKSLFIKRNSDLSASYSSGSNSTTPIRPVEKGREVIKDNVYDANTDDVFVDDHDVIGGQLSGLYDKEGNAALDRPEAVEKIHDTWSAIAVLPSTPFALSEILSAEVWQAISIVIEGTN